MLKRHIPAVVFLIFNLLLCNIHFSCVHISAHLIYSMLLCMQITLLSYCLVAPYMPWLEAPSFTVFIGANSTMDNAIRKRCRRSAVAKALLPTGRAEKPVFGGTFGGFYAHMHTHNTHTHTTNTCAHK